MKHLLAYASILLVGFVAGYAVARIRAVPYQSPPLPPQDAFNLARYRDANRQAKASVVFFGDSIIELWDLEKYFPAKGYLNRGIKLQTTAQLLGRFEQDVIRLNPKTVIIAGGFNDILYKVDQSDTLANIDSMIDVAKSHGIKLILLSIPPPSKEYSWATDAVDALNLELQKRGSIDAKLTTDETFEGPHPNDAGYRKMVAALAPLLKG